MNVYRKDAMVAGAAMAHGDAAPNDKRSAGRWKVSRRTANRWTHDGPPQVKACAIYLIGCDRPERVVAYLAAVSAKDVRDMTKDQLLDAYRQVLRDEAGAEYDDRLADLDPTTPWNDCATRSERDAAIDATVTG